eukprot:XP_011670814.1 PREDICTED: uncharacterized protein LOC105441420 [Strongylocentrotus purpuratus]
MPHLKNLTLHAPMSLFEDFDTSSTLMALSAKDNQSGNKGSATLTELTVDDETLRRWQDYGSMFDNVKRVTIQVRSTITYDVIRRIHLPEATELTIQSDEFRDRPANFHEKPTSLPDVLLNSFPRLVKVTFSDLNIGNSKMELILQAFRSPHNLKNLKTIRFIRCGTDERVDDVTVACNEGHIMEVVHQVEVVHGKPRGLYW